MKWLLLAGMALLFGYEFYALRTVASGDTISEIVWRLSSRPVVPFAFGVLMGHFFWQSGKLSKLPAMRSKWYRASEDARIDAQNFTRDSLRERQAIANTVQKLALEVVADIDGL